MIPGKIVIAVAVCASLTACANFDVGQRAGYLVRQRVIVEERGYPVAGPAVRIPAGHMPPPGTCRVWYPDRPPGHQPPPGGCGELRHHVPPGAVLLGRPGVAAPSSIEPPGFAERPDATPPPAGARAPLAELSTDRRKPVARSEDPPAARRAADHALKMVGKPYRFGGSSPSAGFDCSGLVQFSFSQAGVSLPRTTAQQRYASRLIRPSNLRRGDLLFFERDGEKNSHVAMYVGNGYFVHAPSSGKRVRTDRLDSPYWRSHLSEVRRVQA